MFFEDFVDRAAENQDYITRLCRKIKDLEDTNKTLTQRNEELLGELSRSLKREEELEMRIRELQEEIFCWETN